MILIFYLNLLIFNHYFFWKCLCSHQNSLRNYYHYFGMQITLYLANYWRKITSASDVIFKVDWLGLFDVYQVVDLLKSNFTWQGIARSEKDKKFWLVNFGCHQTQIFFMQFTVTVTKLINFRLCMSCLPAHSGVLMCNGAPGTQPLFPVLHLMGMFPYIL